MNNILNENNRAANLIRSHSLEVYDLDNVTEEEIERRTKVILKRLLQVTNREGNNISIPEGRGPIFAVIKKNEGKCSKSRRRRGN
jgi:hypothetical protein